MSEIVRELLALGVRLMEPMPFCVWAGVVLMLLTGVGARLVGLIENAGTRHGSQRL